MRDKSRKEMPPSAANTGPVWSAATCRRFQRRDMSRRSKARTCPRTPNHGDSRSRWGWWSRFQRLKAASLVSAKRYCNVGNSTWPLQKT